MNCQHCGHDVGTNASGELARCSNCGTLQAPTDKDYKIFAPNQAAMYDRECRSHPAFRALEAEVERLQIWVNDLLTGMYVNCVYCGHRYGPRKNTPVSMADVLKKHIEQCPHHPLSHAKKEIEQLRADLKINAQMLAELHDTTVPESEAKG